MHILVVEDEIKISNLLKKGLEMARYSVDTAYDGQEGLKLAEENGYSLIIMDIMLPKMTGLEVTKKLRDKKINTPIIILTARDTADQRTKGFEAGANDYMLKPFMFTELINRVKILVKR